MHVQEPLPGGPPDPSAEDEEHHRLPGLPGGVLLHVSIWTHAEGQHLAPTLIQMPQAEGWIQLRVNAPAPGYTLAPTVTTP